MPAIAASLCAGHCQQFGSENRLVSLMEVKAWVKCNGYRRVGRTVAGKAVMRQASLRESA